MRSSDPTHLDTQDTKVSAPIRTVAHISDLHFDLSAKRVAKAEALRDALVANGIDHIVMTGDVTESGKAGEYAQFIRVFGALKDAGRLTLVPGNHDRLGDEISKELMDGARVQTTRSHGMHIVRVDSTSKKNRSRISGHGNLDEQVLDDIDASLASVAPGDLTVIALHHHLLPLPEEGILEHLSAAFHLPYASELRHGRALLDRLRGRCDLVLHGHRHIPSETMVPVDGRDLWVYNAGASGELGRFRVFEHAAGVLVDQPRWVTVKK